MTNSDLRCRKILFLICFPNEFICPKCRSREFYIGGKWEMICKDCTFKCEATRNTMFHDTRIGLRKFFDICVEYKKNGFQITCKVIKDKYKLSEKTGYRIIEKLNNNQGLIDKIYDKDKLKDSDLDKQVRLLKYSTKRSFFAQYI